MMTVQEAIESANTCRFYRTDPVTDEVLLRVLDAARYAPSGGNRQPVRFVVVRNPAKRRQLKEWYLPIWEAYAGQAKAAGTPTGARMRMLANADHFAQHLDEVPVLLVVCAVLADIYPTDRNLGRLSIVGGASVYPAVQNVLLKARDEGLGTALTTLLCIAEPQVKELLRIPDGVATAAMLTLGYPVRRFPKRLRRQPLGQSVFAEEFGRPFVGL